MILIETITITPEALELAVGGTQQLETSFTPQDPAPTNTSIDWSTSDETIATVSEGLVTAISAGGPIEITASSTDGSNTSDSISVTVFETEILIEEITIENAVTSLIVGQEEAFTVAINPANATNQSVLWTSSNPEFATVNENTGLITAISPGETMISVETSDGSNLEDSFDVIVEALDIAVEAIVVANDSFSLVEGGTQTIQYLSLIHI